MKSISYTNRIDLEIQDMSKTQIPTSTTTTSSITASGGQPLATASIINPKVTSSATSSAMHSVDKLIEIPSLIEKGKSYQQQHQMIDIDNGSTINHNNNIVVANHGLNFSSSSGKGGGIDGGSLQLNSSYSAVSCFTNDKSTAKAYLNKQPNVSFMQPNSCSQSVLTLLFPSF